MTTKFKKGFTLIELLVVIAIIGILSSIVLGSLSSARTKGQDTAIQAGLSGLRSQAELFYSNNSNSYGTATLTANTTCGSNTENDANLFNKTAVTGNLAAMLTGINATKKCAATPTAFAVEAALSSGFFCVDSAGRATTSVATLIANGTDTVCN